MNRSLNLSINNFGTIPHSLRAQPAVNLPADTCRVDLARLFHHYYLDSYGRRPPNPDPARFEYVHFLADCDDFRMTGDGIGASTATRRNSSTALGQAFCRWFLHDHLNIAYFAHMDKVLNKQLHRGFGPLRLVRTNTGDVPDYLCAESVDRVFFAEAKGRYTSINFTNREFDDWRQQFTRVEIRDMSNKARNVKGFIVGTRFATEQNRPSLKSGIFAEDPKSPGEEPVGQELSLALRQLIVAEHFSGILQKLNQPLLAAALDAGSIIPEQLQLQATVWDLQLDILEGKRFVGGYWPSAEGRLPFTVENGKIIASPADPFRLDHSRGTFFGLEKSVFLAVSRLARSGPTHSLEVEPLEDLAPFYSAISLLRDGSIVGPAEFFLPVGTVTI